MITENSIDLIGIKERCFAYKYETCEITTRMSRFGCGTFKCPFYKPAGLQDWVRVEDSDGINLVPPEEYVAEFYAKYIAKKPP